MSELQRRWLRSCCSVGQGQTCTGLYLSQIKKPVRQEVHVHARLPPIRALKPEALGCDSACGRGAWPFAVGSLTGSLPQLRPSICSCAVQAWGRAWVRLETVRPAGPLPSAMTWMIFGERNASGTRRRMWRSARPSQRTAHGAVRFPIQSGHRFRFDPGHRTDLMPATIPK